MVNVSLAVGGYLCICAREQRVHHTSLPWKNTNTIPNIQKCTLLHVLKAYQHI